MAGVMKRSRRGGVLCATALAAVWAAAPSAASSSTASISGPGCRPTQLAIAHYASGAILDPQPKSRPTPCGVPTGFGTGESTIAVTNTGAVLTFPAAYPVAGMNSQTLGGISPVFASSTDGIDFQTLFGIHAGFARSTNLGRSWKIVQPLSTNIAGAPGYPGWEQDDSEQYLDRDTGRLFWTDPQSLGGLAHVAWTDNNGRTWGGSYVNLGPELTQVSTAKPRPGMTRPHGYPKVVYACGEGTSASHTEAPSLPAVYLCEKSLDGGQTWITAGQGFYVSPVAPHAQCAGQQEIPNFSPYAVPDPSGRLYELVSCAGRTFLTRSADEGATWPIVAQLPFRLPTSFATFAAMRSDASGNLYLAWFANAFPSVQTPYAPGGLYLSVSQDEGRSWTAPLQVLAPGVDGILTGFGFDVGAPGNVEISYFGQRPGTTGFDGYITETFDALARKPLFWSATVDDTSQPPLDFGGAGDSDGLGLDYIGAAIGPDGTAWASFWDACAEDLPQSAPSTCPADRHPSSGTIVYGYGGFVGRLAFGQATGGG